jgi:hypothetical protein
MPDRFVVINNTPGYLPEDDDPFVTEDYSEAVRALNEDVERYVETFADMGTELRVEWGLASADNLAGAAVYDDSREHDLGRWFSIVRDES